MPYIVGIDFDNTLVSYDDVMHGSALKFGLIDKDVPRNKRIIRDEIRRLPDGEMKWCKFQAFVYGERMNEAKLMEGVKDFFDLCKKMGIQVYIVSHKTKFAAADRKGINLRQLALEWMKAQGFFDDEGLGLSPQDVYFEMTRKEKIKRIKELGCTHFIDDLEETFLETSFPKGVQKLLYAPFNGSVLSGDVKVSKTWDDIKEYFVSKTRPPFVLWFTGLSGAGKSTLADKIYNYLKEKHVKTERLDGDTVRHIFPNIGFTKEERDNHIKRIGFLTSMLEKNDVTVIASFISPYKDARDFVRGLCTNFIEVYVKASLETCECRDVKGLYKKARGGQMQNFTGISDPYEEPQCPELVIGTDKQSVEESFLILRDYVDKYLVETKS